MQTTPGGPVTEHYLNFVYQPVKDAIGKSFGIFIEGSDVTAAHQANDALISANEALQKKTDELAQSEAQYRSALVAGRLVHWETDWRPAPEPGPKKPWRCSASTCPDGKGTFGGET